VFADTRWQRKLFALNPFLDGKAQLISRGNIRAGEGSRRPAIALRQQIPFRAYLLESAMAPIYLC
jgi:hypothetical protein